MKIGKRLRTGAKALAALAAGLLLFGAAACSHDSDGNKGRDGGDDDVAVTGVTVAPEKATLYVTGDKTTETLTATVTPSDATDKSVSWQPAPSSRAELSATTGDSITVTAKAAGSVTITATAGGKNGFATIIVYADAASEEKFKAVKGNYEAGGKSFTIAEDGIVTIDGVSSDDPAVVDGDTLTVTISGKEHKISTADGNVTLDDAKAEKVTVSLTKPDGNNNEYDTIKEALAAIPTTEADTYTITLKPVTYYENGLTYNGSATVIIKGNTSEKYGANVIIIGRGSNMSQQGGGSKEESRELLEFKGSGNLILENITFISDYSRADHSGNVQAELVGFDSTGYVAAYNCAFKSHQDTLRTTGKAWFYKCYVEGDTDFLWMESSGIVALYEECEIVSVYDANATTHETKICAPRMSPASKAGKGLVIYNSTVREDENGASQKTYLARTPWKKSDGYWNQVAYIKTSISGVETTPSPWYDSAIKSSYNDCSTADGIARNIIGWKIDRESADSFGYEGLSDQSDIVSETDVANEFSGRRAILNRLYDTNAKKYKKDSETHWDIDTFISGRDWSVTADTSKDLLDGETEAKVTVYEFTTAKDITSYTDLTANGFENESGKNHVQGQAGSTIEVLVTGKAVVTVTGYYKGLGTIQAEGQGKALFDFTNGSTTKTIDKPYVVYADSADTVTITAEDTTYITKITVEYDDSLEFTAVDTIAVSAEDDATAVAANKTLQFTAKLSPDGVTNRDILWSIVSGGGAANIDARSGLLTALAPSADTQVTVRATSCDANARYGEKTITVQALVAGAFDISWLDSKEHSEVDAIVATNSDESVAKGDTGTASDVSSFGSWSYNSQKLKGTSKGGLSVSTTNTVPAGYDSIYIDFPITATVGCTISSVIVGGGDGGTGNALVQVSYKKSAGNFVIVNETGVLNRNDDVTIPSDISIATGETITLRVAIGNPTAGKIESGKSPTIGTVTVYGNKN